MGYLFCSFWPVRCQIPTLTYHRLFFSALDYPPELHGKILFLKHCVTESQNIALCFVTHVEADSDMANIHSAIECLYWMLYRNILKTCILISVK